MEYVIDAAFFGSLQTYCKGPICRCERELG